MVASASSSGPDGSAGLVFACLRCGHPRRLLGVYAGCRRCRAKAEWPGEG